MQGHWTLLHEIGLVWQKHVALSFSYTAVFFLQLHNSIQMGSVFSTVHFHSHTHSICCLASPLVRGIGSPSDVHIHSYSSTLDMIAIMVGTSDRPCWLAEACKIFFF